MTVNSIKTTQTLSAGKRAKLKQLVDVWYNAKGLQDAVHQAGWATTDRRQQQRYKAEAEEVFDVTLEPHNPQHKSSSEIECPSTLDVNAARQANTFLITSATNNSTLHPKFWAALQKFAAAKGAQQIVIPIKYRHNTLIARNDYSWPSEVVPYVLKDDLNVSPHFRISGARPMATAVNPLGGLDQIGGRRTSVYGHPQIALRSIATVKTHEPKMIMTTGSVTSKRYTPTIAGMKGEFFHSFAAVFVYLHKGHPYHIHVNWDGRGFYFLGEYWTADGLKSANVPLAALIGGDEHVAWEDKKHTPTVVRTIKALNPIRLVWHDTHDHRYQGKYMKRTERLLQASQGMFKVEDELKLAHKRILKLGKGRENIIVGSNHDDHLDQWLDKFDADKDPHNGIFAKRLHLLKIEQGVSAFQAWLEPRLKADNLDAVFVDSNRAHMVHGVNLSLHGDKGPNGVRGSLVSIGRLPDRTFIGHSHSAGICWGCYQVGTRTREMKYAEGHSSWSLTDGLLYDNGKRALLVYKFGKSLVDFFG